MLRIGVKNKESELLAVVIRADGSREDLGRIAYYHRNPLRRWSWHIKKGVKTWLHRCKTQVWPALLRRFRR